MEFLDTIDNIKTKIQDRKAAGRWPHFVQLQHPEGSDAPPCPSSTWLFANVCEGAHGKNHHVGGRAPPAPASHASFAHVHARTFPQLLSWISTLAQERVSTAMCPPGLPLLFFWDRSGTHSLLCGALGWAGGPAAPALARRLILSPPCCPTPSQLGLGQYLLDRQWVQALSLAP